MQSPRSGAKRRARAGFLGDQGGVSPSTSHLNIERLIGGENPVRVFRGWRGLTQVELSEALGVDVDDLI